jgi:hypothetical protein
MAKVYDDICETEVKRKSAFIGESGPNGSIGEACFVKNGAEVIALAHDQEAKAQLLF